jgi:hypothetical protein
MELWSLFPKYIFDGTLMLGFTIRIKDYSAPHFNILTRLPAHINFTDLSTRKILVTINIERHTTFCIQSFLMCDSIHTKFHWNQKRWVWKQYFCLLIWHGMTHSTIITISQSHPKSWLSMVFYYLCVLSPSLTHIIRSILYYKLDRKTNEYSLLIIS